jgi:hypothetical protein
MVIVCAVSSVKQLRLGLDTNSPWRCTGSTPNAIVMVTIEIGIER